MAATKGNLLSLLLIFQSLSVTQKIAVAERKAFLYILECRSPAMGLPQVTNCFVANNTKQICKPARSDRQVVQTHLNS